MKFDSDLSADDMQRIQHVIVLWTHADADLAKSYLMTSSRAWLPGLPPNTRVSVFPNCSQFRDRAFQLAVLSKCGKEAGEEYTPENYRIVTGSRLGYPGDAVVMVILRKTQSGFSPVECANQTAKDVEGVSETLDRVALSLGYESAAFASYCAVSSHLNAISKEAGTLTQMAQAPLDNPARTSFFDALCQRADQTSAALTKFVEDCRNQQRDDCVKLLAPHVRVVQDIRDRLQQLWQPGSVVDKPKPAENLTEKPGTRRGGLKEPYCSEACFQQAGKELFSAQMRHLGGPCAFCQQPVTLGEQGIVMFPWRKEYAYICPRCHPRLDNFVAGIKECCMCGKPL